MSHRGYYTESSNFDNVNELLNQAELYRDQALAYSEAASQSSVDAENFADLAANSAAASQVSANDSAAQVAAAELAASNALIYQDNAQASAVNAAISESGALNYSQDAETFKDAAEAAKIGAEAARDDAEQAVVDAAAVLSSALLKGNNLSDLANVSTARTNLELTSSATTANTSANTASTIVSRDGSGNFSAGTITASLSGNATSATALANNAGPTVPALLNSYSNGGTTRYWRSGIQVGVNLNVTRATVGTLPLPVFNLPAGFRPLAAQSFSVAAIATNIISNATVTVGTGGDVSITAFDLTPAGTTSFTATGCFTIWLG